MNYQVKLLKTSRFGDARGWFSETYSQRKLSEAGVDVVFVQDNQSYSAETGTVRGIHFQRPPFAQAKLVRCVRGRIMDYAVDLRSGSPTYGEYVAAELSAENGEQLFVPVGFGHAFVTLEPMTEVAYKVTAPYAPECDGGVIWNDARIAVNWPLPPSGPVLSDKDQNLPALEMLESVFDYEGTPLGEIDIIQL